MPKGANVPLAQEFINFLAQPENAKANMDFIGYTSPIGGDDMFEHSVENYGTYIMTECEAPKEGEKTEEKAEGDTEAAEEEEEVKPFLDKESGKYYCENYVGDMSEEELGKFKNADGTYNFIYPDYDKDDNIIGMHKEENVTLYSSDLNYFFVNGLTGADHRNYTLVTDSIGRQSSAQYPTEDIVTRCAIMQYFNEDRCVFSTICGKTFLHRFLRKASRQHSKSSSEQQRSFCSQSSFSSRKDNLRFFDPYIPEKIS